MIRKVGGTPLLVPSLPTTVPFGDHNEPTSLPEARNCDNYQSFEVTPPFHKAMPDTARGSSSIVLMLQVQDGRVQEDLVPRLKGVQ